MKNSQDSETRSSTNRVSRLILFVLVSIVAGVLAGDFIAGIICEAPIFAAGGALASFQESVNAIVALACVFFAEIIFCRPLLRMTPRQFITDGQPRDGRFLIAVGGLYLLMSVLTCLPALNHIHFNNAEALPRIATLVLCLLLPFQACAEELIFRCALGRIFFPGKQTGSTRKILLVSLLSGLLFMLPHLVNPEVAAYGPLTALSYFIPGFTMMAASLLVGNYRPALVLHSVNNIFSALLVSGDVSALGLAPFFILNESAMPPYFDLFTVLLTNLPVLALAFTWSRKPHHKMESH